MATEDIFDRSWNERLEDARRRAENAHPPKLAIDVTEEDRRIWQCWERHWNRVIRNGRRKVLPPNTRPLPFSLHDWLVTRDPSCIVWQWDNPDGD